MPSRYQTPAKPIGVHIMVTHGYGKILDVDLSTGRILKTDIDPKFALEFLGGMGFGCKILYEEVGADIEPFNAENIIIFANGPLTGTKATSSARTEITTISPMTGRIGTGNTGGLWGARLKHAGFDVIIIRNKAEKPVYLWIEDDTVLIKDAGNLWGKNTVITSDIIKQQHGSAVSVLAIGQAGENFVRYACPVNDYHHVAARSGSGAVMGDKKLKAIAVRGTGKVPIARPDEFREATREVRDRLAYARKFPGFGYIPAPENGSPHQTREKPPWDVIHGSMPGYNFQTGYFPKWMDTHRRSSVTKYIKKNEGPCWSCPMPCCRVADVQEGKYAGLKVARPTALGVNYALGGKCAINNQLAIWKFKEICQQAGMDYVSASGCISFAMELYQRGIISAADMDGYELNWGNEDASIEVLKNIALRKGFGNLLAEGSARAAAKIGKGAEKYVMTTKGIEMMSTDPRAGRRGYVFGVITNPRGGDNIKGAHFLADEYNPKWGIEEYDMFENVKQAAYCVPPQEVPFTWEGKAVMVKWFEDLYSVLNAVGICFFPVGFRLAWGPTHIAKLLSACIGRDLTPEDIMNYGEKFFNLLKAHNVRHGLTRKHDNWPERFYTDPLPEGPAEGAILSRETIDKLLDEYYGLRDWDQKTGIPTEKKLIELGLNDVAGDLKKLGRLPVVKDTVSIAE